MYDTVHVTRSVHVHTCCGFCVISIVQISSCTSRCCWYLVTVRIYSEYRLLLHIHILHTACCHCIRCSAAGTVRTGVLYVVGAVGCVEPVGIVILESLLDGADMAGIMDIVC